MGTSILDAASLGMVIGVGLILIACGRLGRHLLLRRVGLRRLDSYSA